ncbi:tetratricopeptide repeat protein [Flagellimonas hymeniacidonis]|uniref:Tetratricopeptide repeat protein n=1 Tax=Flagellimonas hymeniacidonis TaxID=2603628 RepID=A0A5C8V838_9FLAO|nr:tetratricopeptide repeat protein [Flagellimonas hymeniacidonis]TXN37299.1 tetratricopeptide repeat protein [Flagellimonas hymeniacidonis]
MKLLKFFLALGILLNFSNSNAQQKETSNQSILNKKQSITLTYAQQDVIHSKILNEDKSINIFLPEGFHKSSERHTYPVLMLLENEFFHMVSGVVKHLSSVERMPETIVVSLTDGAHIPKLYTNGSDFWPKDWKQLPFGGNPDPFTAYLKEELFLYLKENYRANDFRMVLGLSTTSIYPLHAFAKETDLFDVYIGIASGDILGMGYKDGESFIDVFISQFEKDKSLYNNKYLYLTSSDSDDRNGSHKIKDNLESLEKRLSSYRSPNFKFISKTFPNEGHYDLALPALHEALNMVFPNERWSAKYRDIIEKPGTAMENLDNHFQKSSTEYGFKILPRAERWNSVNRLSWIGPNLLKQGNAAEAIEVIERWVEYSPKSTLALNELAKAYEANKQFDKAISALEKIYKISSNLDELEWNEYQTLINQWREKVNKQN